jgi:ceramide glucosyltransferase
MDGRVPGRVRRGAPGHVTWLVLGIAIVAAAYQLIALVAVLRHRTRRSTGLRPLNIGISILKPVYGRDDGFYEAIKSHAVQQYPDFEILFGVHTADDPACSDIRRLIAEFQTRSIRLIVCPTQMPNAKVGVLADLASEARYPLLVVNDSDITVPAGYLTNVTAPLSDTSIGLVTCLYRAEACNWPSRFEALAIATEFAPNTLVAPMFGVNEFGLGSTLAFRKNDLERIGGFRAIGDYLADDYQLGSSLHALGLRNVISDVVVSTRISAVSWKSVWRHQLRWARTIRFSRGGGYAGLPVTFATFWVVVAASAGLWSAALALLAIRFATAFACGWLVLGSADVWKYFYVIPVRDLAGVMVWFAGLFGSTVEWRGRSLQLDRVGKIVPGKSWGK